MLKRAQHHGRDDLYFYSIMAIIISLSSTRFWVVLDLSKAFNNDFADVRFFIKPTKLPLINKFQFKLSFRYISNRSK